MRFLEPSGGMVQVDEVKLVIRRGDFIFSGWFGWVIRGGELGVWL